MNHVPDQPELPVATTASGRRFSLLAPRPEDVWMPDIVHALSVIPRWNGHTLGAAPWSILQHSLLVDELLLVRLADDPLLHAYALLHDAEEGIVGDIISPVGKAIAFLAGWDVLTALKDPIRRVIFESLALPRPTAEAWAAVKVADRAASDWEEAAMRPPRVATP